VAGASGILSLLSQKHQKRRIKVGLEIVSAKLDHVRSTNHKRNSSGGGQQQKDKKVITKPATSQLPDLRMTDIDPAAGASSNCCCFIYLLNLPHFPLDRLQKHISLLLESKEQLLSSPRIHPSSRGPIFE
jgi:hypothetical protein